MSQLSNGSRVRRRPPPRLGWPVAAAASLEGDSVAVPSPAQLAKDLPRRVTFGSAAKLDFESQQLWTVKYAPKSSADLAVAPKKVKEIVSWMKQSESKLLLLVGGPGIGKSATVHCVATELGLEVHEWSESYYSTSDPSSSINQLSPLNGFEQFMQQVGTGFQSLQLKIASSQKNKNKKLKTNGAIILLDELPNLHGPDAEARFREILTAHIQQTTLPTVLIFSDTAEGKARPDDLERMIDSKTLYSPACKIMQIHPPTKPKFAKIVQRIATAERNQVSPSYVEELYFRCGGDLRFAISTLQYEIIGGISATQSSAKLNVGHSGLRDTKLSSFHALGKLLYAKRKNGVSGRNCQRQPLEFDPESVVEQSDMEVSGVLHFLEYHCVEFFTDSGELATALGHFSDAALLVDHPAQTFSSSSPFPTVYACSLAGRAVANANLHPAPFKFRQFSTPKVFDVIRKRRGNEIRIQKVCSERIITTSAAKASFAVDIMPFVRTILPNHYVSSSFLGSYFDPSRSVSRTDQHTDDEAAVTAQLWQEQQEVLQLDDIINDDVW